MTKNTATDISVYLFSYPQNINNCWFVDVLIKNLKAIKTNKQINKVQLNHFEKIVFSAFSRK